MPLSSRLVENYISSLTKKVDMEATVDGRHFTSKNRNNKNRSKDSVSKIGLKHVKFLYVHLQTQDLLKFDLDIGFLMPNCICRHLEMSRIPHLEGNIGLSRLHKFFLVGFW